MIIIYRQKEIPDTREVGRIKKIINRYPRSYGFIRMANNKEVYFKVNPRVTVHANGKHSYDNGDYCEGAIITFLHHTNWTNGEISSNGEMLLYKYIKEIGYSNIDFDFRKRVKELLDPSEWLAILLNAFGPNEVRTSLELQDELIPLIKQVEKNSYGSFFIQSKKVIGSFNYYDQSKWGSIKKINEFMKLKVHPRIYWFIAACYIGNETLFCKELLKSKFFEEKIPHFYLSEAMQVSLKKRDEISVNQVSDINDEFIRYMNSTLNRNITTIKEFINSGVDVNYQDVEGNSALILASRFLVIAENDLSNGLEILKLLLNAGADVDIANNEGITALTYTDYLQVHDLLLDSGSNVKVKDAKGNTTIHHFLECPSAYYKKDGLEILSKLIEKGANVNASNNEGITPLMICRWHEEAKILLVAGANPDIQDTKGNTALHHCNSINIEKLNTLFLYGLNPNIKNNEGIDAVIHFSKTFYDFNEDVQRLFKKCKVFNSKDSKGKTSIMYTINNEIMSFLVKNDVDINAQDEDGNTALLLAAVKNRDRYFCALVENGANIHIKNKKGISTYDYVMDSYNKVITTYNGLHFLDSYDRLSWRVSSVFPLERMIESMNLK